MNGLCMYSLRAAAITNTLSHEADIAKLQGWLGHANVSTTQLYDRRKTQPQDSLIFRVRYQVNLMASKHSVFGTAAGVPARHKLKLAHCRAVT